mmetsp:Transcript_18494/g.56813  ORF Transcript_18494/g.56813 Transcript_18494/m.56813 type:complete len:271 (-) Transcript_18494:518-1330(-)
MLAALAMMSSRSPSSSSSSSSGSASGSLSSKVASLSWPRRPVRASTAASVSPLPLRLRFVKDGQCARRTLARRRTALPPELMSLEATEREARRAGFAAETEAVSARRPATSSSLSSRESTWSRGCAARTLANRAQPSAPSSFPPTSSISSTGFVDDDGSVSSPSARSESALARTRKPSGPRAQSRRSRLWSGGRRRRKRAKAVAPASASRLSAKCIVSSAGARARLSATRNDPSRPARVPEKRKCFKEAPQPSMIWAMAVAPSSPDMLLW